MDPGIGCVREEVGGAGGEVERGDAGWMLPMTQEKNSGWERILKHKHALDSQ